MLILIRKGALEVYGNSKLINCSSDSLAPRIMGSKFSKTFNIFHLLEISIFIPKYNN